MCGKERFSVIRMYPDHHALVQINSVLKKTGMDVLLMDGAGNVVFPEGDGRRFRLPPAALEKPFAPVVYGGVTLMGVPSSPNCGNEGSLYLSLSGVSKEVRSCAIMCAELISMILRGGAEEDNTLAAARLLRGECNLAEAENIAEELGIAKDRQRCVMCVYSQKGNDMHLDGIVEEFASGEGDIAVKLSANVTAVIKETGDDGGFEGVDAAANSLYERLRKADADAYLGVSEPKTGISGLAEGLNEAKKAINAGGIYCPEERLLIYRKLLPELFVYKAGRELKDYREAIFDKNTARLFTEEMVNTLKVFLSVNLNLSEAARTMGIHRNTLVYRLEKVQKLTGYDLRDFDDAAAFKLLMLLNRNPDAVIPRI